MMDETKEETTEDYDKDKVIKEAIVSLMFDGTSVCLS